MNNNTSEKSSINLSFLNEVKQLVAQSRQQAYAAIFSVQQLYYMRQFYLVFPQIFPTGCGILTWSHYKRLLSVTSEAARNWYLKEASEQYLLCMPTKEELRKEIEAQKELFALQQADKNSSL